MSYRDFEKAMSLAPQCKYYTTAGGTPQEEIQKSEELLQIKFSRQCMEFYEKYGYLSFWGCEIFGVDPYGDPIELEGNSVAYALNDRKVYHLPDEWIPVYNFGDGNLAFLDYGTLDGEQEPRVIMAHHNGKKYIMSEELAEDFGAFLLGLVEDQLDDQEGES